MESAKIEHLIELIRGQYILNWHGIHGINHWHRVRVNGLRLAERTGADLDVIELFAFFHDSCRFNDGYDPGHGGRAADFLTSLHGTAFKLPDESLELLTFACRYHTDGLTEADVTVQTCWDADRLDLGRVGIKPEAKYLCTGVAQDPEIIDWAYRRSRSR